tara:strand:+ start:1545 stop:1877 length:333 start_codon:yes stop_codon:yes gene_type:complete
MPIVNLGTKITDELNLFARPDEHAENGFDLMLVNDAHVFLMRDTDIKIDTVTVTFSPPNKMTEQELIMLAVATLREKQKTIQADAGMRVAQLDEQINKMLLLTHQTPVAG